MDVHLSAINGLKNNFIVYNYQIRKISALKEKNQTYIGVKKGTKETIEKKNFQNN